MIIIKTNSGHDFKYDGAIIMSVDDDVLYVTSIFSRCIHNDKAQLQIFDRFFMQDVKSIRGEDDLHNLK